MIKRLMVLALAAGLFVGAGDLYAQCSKCPLKACAAKNHPALSEAKSVTKAEVASLIQKGNITIVDARDVDSYNAGHIAGAINLTKASLPSDKNSKIVFYCAGTFCSAAPKAAKMAIQAGYKNVMVFHGGWAEWSKGQS
jgi:rhodanese-related sulfurtransferase